MLCEVGHRDRDEDPKSNGGMYQTYKYDTSTTIYFLVAHTEAWHDIVAAFEKNLVPKWNHQPLFAALTSIGSYSKRINSRQ